MAVQVEPVPAVPTSADMAAVRPDMGRTAPRLREYAETIALAVLVAVFIRCFVVQAFKIPSGSMLPTLRVGDHVLLNKLAYGVRLPIVGDRIVSWGKPARGDVVVFVLPRSPSKDFIKRVIGVPGDVIQIRDKHVYLNGAPYRDGAAYFAGGLERGGPVPRDNYGPVAVPPGHVFVLGDNRDQSYDSRFWGFVRIDDIEGRAFFVYWSWHAGQRRVRWERVGTLIR